MNLKLANLFEFIATFLFSWGVYVLWFFLIINSPDLPLFADWLYVTVWWLCNILFISLLLCGYFYIVIKTKKTEILKTRKQLRQHLDYLNLLSGLSILTPFSLLYTADQIIRLSGNKIDTSAFLYNIISLNLLFIATILVVQMFLAWIGGQIAYWLITKTEFRYRL